MDAWRDIRLRARDFHRQTLAAANGDRTSAALVKAALFIENLQLRYFAPGTVTGEGVYGFLDRPSLLVNVAQGQSLQDEVAVIAHELGHFRLHRDPRNEVTVRASVLGGDPIEGGPAKVDGYSPRERKEVQADIFAGEFLCPADWLREQIVDSGKRPSQIALELGLAPELVVNQAIRALLLPSLRAPKPETQQAHHTLDSGQLEAATWSTGPLLVDAGPGTGKTRTLVHRIRHLLDGGVGPSTILALTFSKKAAEEMRERPSTNDADAAIEMWVSTFHAFGRELITKWHNRIGRSDHMRILDDSGSLALLEENLLRLPLRHFQNLYEPAFELTYILKAISRCKDELITPEQYRAEAAAALSAAATPDQREAAEKAMEVAEVYEVYEDALCQADAVDFGDLIRLAIRLLKENPDVLAEVQGHFKHILIDEYQDVNFASACFLRTLCKAGSDVWVVADQRQSIYRFRGASPSNVVRFPAEFGGDQRALSTNYRSAAPVIRAFERFSGTMFAGRAAGGSWKAHRGNIGGAMITTAPTLAAEAAAMRDRIEDLKQQGIPYAEQAILARSHLTLSRVTGELEKLGVLLLYLGDVFERFEIRDLLSLVAMDAEFGGIGLVRVAQLPEYRATKADALTILRWAHRNKVPVFEALTRIPEIENLGDQGRAGLAKLGQHLAGFGPQTSPWKLLTTWLFERSNYLAPLLATADDTSARQKLIAIYQLLKVCSEHAGQGDPSRRRFLERVRRIEALNEERIYRTVASEASDMDAVRVLTIHASKGLEFGAVHLPVLATRYMPSTKQYARCPPPTTLPQLAMQTGDHDAEEECLFFVAMSRARDFLCISRAERYTAQNSSASKFLNPLSGVLSQRPSAATGAPPISPLTLDPQKRRDRYEEPEISVYLNCPARYRYEIIDGLKGGRDQAAYVRFHGCVYRTIGWLEAEHAQGRAVDAAGAAARLASEWAKDGPTGYGLEAYYRAAAEGMVSSMVSVITHKTGTYDREEWLVDVGGRTIAVTPDRVVLRPDGSVHVQRVRTGRRTKSEPSNRIYALLRRGAIARYPGRRIHIETFYPATGEAVPAEEGRDDKLLAEYGDALAAIERGEFPADPETRRCANCQCYFICGA